MNDVAINEMLHSLAHCETFAGQRRVVKNFLASHAEKVAVHEQEIIARFLARTGQYVTNDASREAAIAAALAQPAPVQQPLKDHQIAKLVNDLRDVAKEYGQTQQLRERIAGIARDALAPPAPEPAAWPSLYEITGNIADFNTLLVPRLAAPTQAGAGDAKGEKQ